MQTLHSSNCTLGAAYLFCERSSPVWEATTSRPLAGSLERTVCTCGNSVLVLKVSLQGSRCYIISMWNIEHYAGGPCKQAH